MAGKRKNNKKEKKNDDLKVEESKHAEEEKHEEKESLIAEKKEKRKKSVRTGHIVIGILVIIGVILSLIYLLNPKSEINANGKSGYIYTYNGYEFWQDEDGFWNTKMTKHSGDVQYVATFYYGPRDLEDITIVYRNNTFAEQLDTDKKAYITFDPEDTGMAYIAVAASSLSTALKKVYFSDAIASCTKPIDVCENRPTITCDNTDSVVIFVDSDPEMSVVYEKNCLIIKGQGDDLIRAVNKALLGWYGIVK
ncbi:MAG: hypothetical protein V1659_01390 [Candidatus Woesearchaeota archaeon]